MSLIKRIGWTFRGFINSLLSKAEDLEQMLQIAIEQMQQSLEKNIHSAAHIKGVQSQLKARLDQEVQRRYEIERRLTRVIQENKTEYIQMGRLKLAEADSNIDLLGSQLAGIDGQFKEVLEAIKVQKTELEKMTKQRQGLVAQAKASVVLNQVYKELDVNSSSSALGLFTRSQEKIQALNATGFVRRSIYGSEFDSLPMAPTASLNIEAELQALNKGVDSLPGATVTQTTTTWSRETDGTFSIPPVKPIEPIKPMQQEPQDFFNV